MCKSYNLQFESGNISLNVNVHNAQRVVKLRGNEESELEWTWKEGRKEEGKGGKEEGNGEGHHSAKPCYGMVSSSQSTEPQPSLFDFSMKQIERFFVWSVFCCFKI